MKPKLLSLLLAAGMTVSMLTVPALAAEDATGYDDVSGHWAESSINRWSGYGVVQGSDGSFMPNTEMTRGQMAVMLSNLLGLTEKADNHYADLKGDEWYADAILRCTAAGILQGDGENCMPNLNLTREQAAVLMGRTLGITPAQDTDLSQFPDGDQVSDWAAGYMAAMVEAGIIKGTGSGQAAPGLDLDRASAMTILDRTVSEYVMEDGATVTLDGESKGLVLVVASDVVLQGEIAGNVLLAPAADGGSLTLKDATVAGTVTVQASGAQIKAENAELNTVVMDGADSDLSLSGTTSAALVETTQRAQGSSLTVEGGSSVTSVDSKAEGVTIGGAGKVDSVSVSGNNTAVNTSGTKVEVSEGVTGTTANGQEVPGGSGTETDPAVYTVTFDSAEGTPVESQQVTSGQTVSKPQDPTREGYTFLGWFNGDQAYDFSAPVTAPLTLTAKWVSGESSVAYIGQTGYATLAEAVAAAQAEDVITLLADVTADAQITLAQAITLDGAGHKLTVSHSNTAGNGAGLLVMSDSVIIRSLTVVGPNANPEGWDNGQYGVKVYDAEGVVLTDLTVTGANAGIQINGSQVSMTGTIDVSGNEFGGIEVSKGVEATQASTLDLTGATLVHTTESSSNPVLWVDGVEAGNTVTGGDHLTPISVSDDKVHYYLADPMLLAVEAAQKFHYDDFTYTGDFEVKVDGSSVNVSATYTFSQLTDAMNDMARFLGALYRHDEGATIQEITYADTAYRWANTPSNLGSNWVKDVAELPNSGNTLVSAIVAAYQEAPLEPIVLTLTGPEGTNPVTLTFAPTLAQP